MALLKVSHLVMEFDPQRTSWGRGRTRKIRAVDDVSFEIEDGEAFGLVGESGSGKTTLTRCILGLLRPASGRIMLRGRPVADYRPSRIQAVFQDSLAALNPTMRIRRIIEEPLAVQRVPVSLREDKIEELLLLTALPTAILKRLPAEISAGQRQRVAIARALATDPELLIADEPTSSLDAPLQLQILEELQSIQQRRGLTLLLVTHDLAAAKRFCDRVAVMRSGRLVEVATVEDLFAAPSHPYTRQLIESATSV